MLVHIQKPGATFVAPPSRWLDQFGRKIKVGARPLVILRPMGPVMFVFDVGDTEPLDKKKLIPLPPGVENPFEVRSGRIGTELDYIIENAKRDGVRITIAPHGSQAAGSIRRVDSMPNVYQKIQVGYGREKVPTFIQVPVRYELLTNDFSHEARYATIAHELGHLYCGHLGTPNKDWWPDRRGLDHASCEFEAESVTFLICKRLNLDTPAETYLAGYLKKKEQVPPISLECVMKAAGLLETMNRERMKPRKEKKRG